MESLDLVARTGPQADVQSGRGDVAVHQPQQRRAVRRTPADRLELRLVLLLVDQLVEPDEAERAERGVVERGSPPSRSTVVTVRWSSPDRRRQIGHVSSRHAASQNIHS